ncbi:glucose-1-phosphate cytidylyltransferase [Mucilaginibacter jinjuensis]|uniref:Glucose-1-phosphate cytidylyltransferase n=1 Tax=Mucilaginibacter jinjuensis TaxID=1176721 RepID=A0ABY7T6N4_9SPHI|nr:glucose-1-phosphate cytidylyltransferase [Mucilaginibacter jinjuensis]WCT11878.1 glucose-1-phosphate cytidylyltransferase [Mucilaginibacter jinjuensis]
MKVVLLAGGLGTRLAEETSIRPKPMVEIGGKPILWHIMKIYSHYGFNEFVICLGYKGNMIKEYFINYFLYNSDITVELHNNQLDVHYSNSESFKVTLVDTGIDTNTAGRIKKIKKYITEDTFMLSYGDGVSNVNIEQLLAFHKKHGKLATLTTIQHPGRFGNVSLNDDGIVTEFAEKPDDEGFWINGGYFVLSNKIFDYLEGDVELVQWEREPLASIANDGQLAAFKHKGYWKAMDAMRDKIELEAEWSSGSPRWKIW